MRIALIAVIDLARAWLPNKPSYDKWEVIAGGAELEPRPVPAACCDDPEQQLMVAVSWHHQAPTDCKKNISIASLFIK